MPNAMPNDMPREDSVHGLIRRLAGSLTGEAANVLELIQAVRLAAHGTSGSRLLRAAPDAADRLGVWDVERDEGSTRLRMRDISPSERRRWADVPETTLHDDRTRVAVIGESAARGYLLDPEANLAVCLQRELDAAPGSGPRHECVDLAVSGASAQEILDVLAGLPLIDPDVVVVMAGNNWILPRLTAIHLVTLGAALREGGVDGLREAFWEQVARPEVDVMLDALERVVTTTGARLVMVTTAFNQSGWPPPTHRAHPPPATPRFAGASADQPPSGSGRDAPRPGTGFWDRAQEHVAAGRHGAAARELTAAMDVAWGMFSGHTPRTVPLVRHRIARFCTEHGVENVDLHDVLGDGTGMISPAWFLDYCHLTHGGLHRVAGVVSRLLVPDGTVGEGTRADRDGAVHPLPAPVEASALLLAAWHNVRTGQPAHYADRLLRAAVDTDPESMEWIGACRRMLSGNGPVWAAKELDVLRRTPNAARYLDSGIAYDREALGLGELLVALDAVDPSSVPRRRAPAPGPVDLLAMPTGGMGLGHTGSDYRPGMAYVACRSPRSGWHVDLPDGTTMSELSVTYRTQPDVTGTVTVNGMACCVLDSRACWSTVAVPLDPERTRPGLNVVGVVWATSREPGPDLARAAAAMERGEMPDLQARYADLFRLRLQTRVVGR